MMRKALLAIDVGGSTSRAFLVDIAGYWRVNKNVRLHAGIFNLTDKRYWNYSSTRSLQPANPRDRQQIEVSSAPGRTYAVSLNVDF